VFSNTAAPSTHLNVVREACNRTGIEVDVAGSAMNTSVAAPESLLANYDLVFAKARCALEALSVGTAVILCDSAGSGPLVTTNQLEQLRRLNRHSYAARATESRSARAGDLALRRNRRR
jgi:hypothetical protein